MTDRHLFPLLSAFEDRRLGVIYTVLLVSTLVLWFQAGGRPEPMFVIVALPAGVAVQTMEARYGGMCLLGAGIVSLLLLVVSSDLPVAGTDTAWLSGVVGFLLGYLLSVLQSARRGAETDDATAP